MDPEITSNLIDADKCLAESEDFLLQKNVERCHDKINEARELIQEILKLDERKGDMELERSKILSKSHTLPYSEKFG